MLIIFASAPHVMSYIQGAQGTARFREAKYVGFFSRLHYKKRSQKQN